MATPTYRDLDAREPGVRDNVAAVLQAMDHLFCTEKDELPFFLDFTASFETLLFKDLSFATAVEVYALALSALERFEPRVVVDESRSSVTVNDEEDGYDIVFAVSIRGFESDPEIYQAFLSREA